MATDAERDSKDLKKVEFMERHLGDDFVGTIGGVAAFGFFVLLDQYFVEGLVHVSSLNDDYYEFYEDQYAVIGRRSGQQYRLGDRVQVQVARVNREERKIDFILLKTLEKSKARPRKKQRRARRYGGSRSGDRGSRNDRGMGLRPIGYSVPRSPILDPRSTFKGLTRLGLVR